MTIGLDNLFLCTNHFFTVDLVEGAVVPINREKLIGVKLIAAEAHFEMFGAMKLGKSLRFRGIQKNHSV